MTPLANCTREQLHACTRQYFKDGGATEPEVALVELNGMRAILKDYGRTPGWFGYWIAPILIWREATALARLDDLRGVPRLYRQLDRRAILMEYLPAKQWAQVRPEDISYARLADLIDAMHIRGVAHCDLRAPSNILVDEQGWPQIVDFVARMHRGRMWNLPWNWCFRRFCVADQGALIKLKHRFAKHLLTREEHAAWAHSSLLDRAARRIGSGVRRLTRFFVRKR